MDYENIIEDIGGFGYWQRLIFLAICLPDITFAFALLLPVFTGSEPNWRCDEETGNHTDPNNSTTNNRNVTETWVQGAGDDNPSLCDKCKSHEFNDSFTTIVSEWDLICERDYVSDLVSSFQLAGLILGAAMFSQMSDLYGRKKTHFSTTLLLVVAGLLSAFSTNWQMFAALRLVVGISSGGFFSVTCVYPLEFISRKWRTLCGTVGFWPLGQFLLALLAYLITDWRYLTAATAGIALPYMLLWWFLPESPRWLLQRGHTKEAKAIFTNIAVKNKKPVPNMDFLDNLAETKGDIPLHKYSYLDLFRQRITCKRTIVCSILWFVVFLVYYEFAYNMKHLSGNRYLNVVYGALFDLIGIVLVVTFNNILGRRLCLIITMAANVVISATIFIIYVLHKDAQLDTVVTWLALAGKGFGITGVYLLQIYTSELFPTDVRNLGVGAAAVAGRIGCLLAPQVLYLGTKIPIFPYALMSGLCAATIPLLFIVPETNGKPLTDDFNLNVNKRDPEDTESKL